MGEYITSFLTAHIPSVHWTAVYIGNTVGMYVTAIVIFLLLLFVFGLFQRYVLRALTHAVEKTQTDIDDAAVEIVKSVKPPFYSFLAFYGAAQSLVLNEFLEKFITVVLVIWVIYQIVRAAQIMLRFLFSKFVSTEQSEHSRKAALSIGRFVEIGLWAAGLLFLLSNLGVDITSLIAGLGIGGIAIAFALQNILADLFSSFAIIFDKPFEIGDFIVVGEHMGTVERIGIKTTRIRALQGEEIVISNRELTSARVQNYRKLNERRIAFRVGFTYETPQKKLEQLPEIVKEVIENTKGVRFDRAHFLTFGDFALEYEIVYYVLSSDYAAYCDAQQEINLGLVRECEKHAIGMAYPTQRVIVDKQ